MSEARVVLSLRILPQSKEKSPGACGTPLATSDSFALGNPGTLSPRSTQRASASNGHVLLRKRDRTRRIRRPNAAAEAGLAASVATLASLIDPCRHRREVRDDTTMHPGVALLTLVIVWPGRFRPTKR